MTLVCGFFSNFAQRNCAQQRTCMSCGVTNISYKQQSNSAIMHNNIRMKKVLFVNQDITPYVAETELSLMGKMVPQRIQEAGTEIRVFMPRWGNINERRGQLHEVIRLSGLNIQIDDTDHPLIIKVASIPATKMQVYFIDNDEYFTRKGQVVDGNGQMYADNGERAAFFARGVIATIKKLRWSPDVIHCQGWMSALIPIYVKKMYGEELGLDNVKIVVSLFDQPQQEEMNANTKNCIAVGNVTEADTLAKYADQITSRELEKLAIDYADGLIIASENVDNDIISYAEDNGSKMLKHNPDDFTQQYLEFYDSLFE